MQTIAEFKGTNGIFVIKKKEHPFPLFQKLWIELWRGEEPELTFLPYIQEFPRKDYTAFLISYDPARDYGLALTILQNGIMLNVNEKFTYLVIEKEGELFINEKIMEIIGKGSYSIDNLIGIIEEIGKSLGELLQEPF